MKNRKIVCLMFAVALNCLHAEVGVADEHTTGVAGFLISSTLTKLAG